MPGPDYIIPNLSVGDSLFLESVTVQLSSGSILSRTAINYSTDPVISEYARSTVTAYHRAQKDLRLILLYFNFKIVADTAIVSQHENDLLLKYAGPQFDSAYLTTQLLIQQAVLEQCALQQKKDYLT